MQKEALTKGQVEDTGPNYGLIRLVVFGVVGFAALVVLCTKREGLISVKDRLQGEADLKDLIIVKDRLQREEVLVMIITWTMKAPLLRTVGRSLHQQES